MYKYCSANIEKNDRIQKSVPDLNIKATLKRVALIKQFIMKR